MRVPIEYKHYANGELRIHINSWDDIVFTQEELNKVPSVYEPGGPTVNIKQKEANKTREERFHQMPSGEKAAFWAFEYWKQNPNKKNWDLLWTISFLLLKTAIARKYRNPAKDLNLNESINDIMIDLTNEFMIRFNKEKGNVPSYSFSNLIAPYMLKLPSYKKTDITFTDYGMTSEGIFEWNLIQ